MYYALIGISTQGGLRTNVCTFWRIFAPFLHQSKRLLALIHLSTIGPFSLFIIMNCQVFNASYNLKILFNRHCYLLKFDKVFLSNVRRCTNMGNWWFSEQWVRKLKLIYQNPQFKKKSINHIGFHSTNYTRFQMVSSGFANKNINWLYNLKLSGIIRNI